MAAATMYVTVAGAGDKSGSSWANAMGYAEFEADFEAAAEAGDIYYVYGPSQTYTLTGTLYASNSGTTSVPIYLIGVSDQEVAPTEATGTDRPLFAAGANQFGVNNWWKVRNLQVTTTHASGFSADYACTIDNCKFTNSSGTASRYGLTTTVAPCKVTSCEATSTNGWALRVDNGTTFSVIDCYFHDSVLGIYVSAFDGAAIQGCIFDGCSDAGVNLPDNTSYGHICNCTFYGCGAGVLLGNHSGGVFLNNIFDTCTTGASAGGNYGTNEWDYNNYKSNGTDVTNVTKGPNATASDPQFVNAAAGDFTLTAGSPCLTNGMPISLGVATPVTTHQGAVPPVAGAGTSGPSTGVIDQQFVR